MGMPKMKHKGKTCLVTTTMKTTTTKAKPKPGKKRPSHKNNPKSNIITLFCSTLAALKIPLNLYSKPLILKNSNKFLYHLHPNSLPSSPSSLESLLNAILTLLPPMLYSSCDDVVCAAAKMVVMASMVSIEVNQKIACDVDIVKGLCVNVLRVENVAAKKSVCNAVLDLCLTSVGCQTLLHLSALNYLLLGFHQVRLPVASPLSINLIESRGAKFLGVEHDQDEVPLLIINAAATLTNFCNSEQLKKVPRRLKEAIIPRLREIWSKLHEQFLASDVLNNTEVKLCYTSNLTVQNLAESLFRLSMDAAVVNHSMPSEVVVSHIFGPCSSSFTDFLSEYWESLPLLIRTHKTDSLFSSFLQSLTCEETLPRFLSSTLEGMVSCPPLGLNEIDSLGFLNDVRDTLGSPLVYQQDIRVVKTSLHSKSEEHYFQDNSSNGNQVPRTLSAADIINCETAYREGYTIALQLLVKLLLSLVNHQLVLTCMSHHLILKVCPATMMIIVSLSVNFMGLKNGQSLHDQLSSYLVYTSILRFLQIYW